MISRVTHKYSVEIPTSVDQAKKLDEKNSNTLQIDAMNREMDALKVTFYVMEDGFKIPVGHNKASSHLSFDARITLE